MRPNSPALVRLSVAALFIAALAGAFISAAIAGAQDSPSPVDNADPKAEAFKQSVLKVMQEAEDGKPAARRTAYIDFLTLMKNDTPLRIEQWRIADEMRLEMDSIDRRWEPKIKECQRDRELNLPHTKAYRDAMNKQLEFEKSRYQQKLQFEQDSSKDLRTFAIDRFIKLRNLTADTAKGLGYNEVLNIVRDVEKIALSQDDFQALQQQLLVSPVLYFDKAHDITDLVQAEANKIWGESIAIVAWDAEKKTGGISLALEKPKAKPEDKTEYEAQPLARNAEGEIEIRLGARGRLGADVLDKGEKAAGDRARVRFSKRGVGVGELGEIDGTYAAPAEFPAADTFVVTARSVVDPTVSIEVTIRLLDKDGKRMPKRE